jgi:hypothetical protein
VVNVRKTPAQRNTKPTPSRSLLAEIRNLIIAAREHTARSVNISLSMLYR